MARQSIAQQQANLWHEQKDPDNAANVHQAVEAEKAISQIQKLVRAGLAEPFEN